MNRYPEDMTVAEAAVVFKVTDQTVRGWIKAGRIKAFKNLSGRWRIPRSEVDRAGGYRPDESSQLDGPEA